MSEVFQIPRVLCRDLIWEPGGVGLGNKLEFEDMISTIAMKARRYVASS